ncbi:MAG: VTT domain-containing protein [Lactobacillaceae bacterium]|nr:VTT domain-containing protein [Lactobacillaceae bacterium]
MNFLIDFILHIDSHLLQIVHDLGSTSYLLMFGIIFIETGAVVLPFLPGDSLLFASGAIAAASNDLNVWILFFGFFLASLFGDNLNFAIGHFVGEEIFKHKKLTKFIKPEYLKDTEAFFEKHGTPAIIFSRYIPIIRTFAPFVSAVSGYEWRKFFSLSLIATTSWSLIGVGAGYLFGNIPVIKEHFSAIIIGVVLVSLLPAAIGLISSKIRGKQS